MLSGDASAASDQTEPSSLVYSFAHVNEMLWSLPLMDDPTRDEDASRTARGSHGIAKGVFDEAWRRAFRSLPPTCEEEGNIFQRYFYSWLNPYIALAAAEQLEEDRFPHPQRAHSAWLCGSRLSAAYRDGELREGRDRWRRCIEIVTRPQEEAATDAPPTKPPVVFPNPLSEVYFRGEPLVRGRLRWVGYIAASDHPHELFAGVEWQHGLPAYRLEAQREAARAGDSAAAAAGVVHRGTVHGEKLFIQAWHDGPPSCTCEAVQNIILLHDPHCTDAARPPQAPSFMRVLLGTFKADLLSIIPPHAVSTLCQMLTPLLLQWYVRFLESPTAEGTLSDGVVILLMFGCVKLIQPLAGNKSEHRAERTASLFRSSTLTAIFEKCITVSSGLGKPEMRSGRVLAMASADVENIVALPLDVMFLWSSTAQLLFYVGYLFYLVGWSAAVCAAVLLAAFPIEALMARWQGKLRAKLSACTDERMNKTNELLSGIRIVKTMGWESKFLQNIEKDARAAELRYRQLLQWSQVLTSFTVESVPSLMIMLVILLYTLTGHALTAEVVFPVIAVLGAMTWPIMTFPMTLSTVMKFVVSARRVGQFLECDDHHTSVRDIEALFGGAEGPTPKTSEGTAPSVWFDDATVTATIAAPLPPCAPRFPKKGFMSRLRRLLHAHDPVELQWVEETAPATTTVIVNESSAASRSGEDVAGDDDEDEDGSANTHIRYGALTKVLLDRVNLCIPRGKLTVVVGATGSGKSTLFSAILGALNVAHNGGKLWVEKNMAYVPQQAWIMQDTIRANIIFYDSMSPPDSTDAAAPQGVSGAGLRRYLQRRRHTSADGAGEAAKRSWKAQQEARLAHAIRCCQLEQDLKELSNGIYTEIGEKGVNLSGGQKARVNLARAVYVDRELYLLDDPLSALDANVGKRIFDEVILEALKDKTRILVTHQLHVLPHADRVVVMNRGTVVFDGSYAAYAQSAWRTQLEQAGDVSESGQYDGVAHATHPVNEFSPVASPTAEQTEARALGAPPTDSPSPARDGREDHPGTALQSSSVVDVPTADAQGEAESGRLIEAEEKESGQVPWAVYCRYFQAAGGYTQAALVLLAFIFAESLLTGGGLWLTAWTTNTFPSLSRTGYLTFYILLMVATIGAVPLTMAVAYRFYLRAGRTLHAALLLSITSGTINFFDATPLGRIVNRFAKDIYIIDEDLPEETNILCQITSYVISSLIVTAISTPLTIVVMLVAAVAFYYLLRFYSTVIREVRRRGSIAQSPMFSLLGEIMSGRESIAAYGKSHVLFAEALRRIDKVYSCAYVEKVINQWLSIRVEYIGCLVMIAVACAGVIEKMYSGSEGLSSGRVGLISISLTMCLDLFWSLPEVVRFGATVEASANSIQRVTHYIDNVSHEELFLQCSLDADDDPSCVVVEEQHGAGDVPPRGEESAEVAGSIRFEHVNLRYRPHLPLVLRDLSFRVRPREKIGVVGRTGSGKSTLLLTLMHLIDTCGGEIFVSGRPLASYTLPQLRRCFAMIPQDPVLFDGTVRSNVDPFGESADTEVAAALHMVGLMSARAAPSSPTAIATSIDVSLDTSVQEGGKNFSVGQRQLLCLARALLKKGSQFILMDEATANIDPLLDKKVQEVVRKSFVNYTVITIAHRLHTVAPYDRVLVLQHGSLVEEGAPRALLMNRDSKFFHMVAQGAALTSRDTAASVSAALSPAERAILRERRVNEVVESFLKDCQ